MNLAVTLGLDRPIPQCETCGWLLLDGVVCIRGIARDKYRARHAAQHLYEKARAIGVRGGWMPCSCALWSAVRASEAPWVTIASATRLSREPWTLVDDMGSLAIDVPPVGVEVARLRPWLDRVRAGQPTWQAPWPRGVRNTVLAPDHPVRRPVGAAGSLL